MTSRTAVAMTYTEFPNKLVSAANGVDYAYREAATAGCRWFCCSTSAGISTAGIRR